MLSLASGCVQSMVRWFCASCKVCDPSSCKAHQRRFLSAVAIAPTTDTENGMSPMCSHHFIKHEYFFPLFAFTSMPILHWGIIKLVFGRLWRGLYSNFLSCKTLIIGKIQGRKRRWVAMIYFKCVHGKRNYCWVEYKWEIDGEKSTNNWNAFRVM